MRSNLLRSVGLLGALGLGCAAAPQPVRSDGAPHAVMYQYSVLDALLAGVFDGDLTFGELKRHGDFGIGTFNALDGEMVMYAGTVYRVRYDGSVHPVTDAERTPNAWVTVFQPTQTIALPAGATLRDVQAELGRRLLPNRPYAIEIRGLFATVNARSEDPATPPYAELAAHMASHQRELTLTDNRGVAVGFLLPPYLARVNVPGLHLHYLADDRRAGGHLIDLRGTGALTVRIMELAGVDIELSRRTEFDAIDLSRDRQRELRQVEHQPETR